MGLAARCFGLLTHRATLSSGSVVAAIWTPPTEKRRSRGVPRARVLPSVYARPSEGRRNLKREPLSQPDHRRRVPLSAGRSTAAVHAAGLQDQKIGGMVRA